jgi:endonuclease/exonuclease/phosphatase (EEP) superfamily protein YafD
MVRKLVYAGSALLGFLLALGAIYTGCQYTRSPATLQPAQTESSPATTSSVSDHLIVMTWNIRGYPESTPEYTAWLPKQVADAKADVLCVQEIANQSKVNAFIADDWRLKHVAFRESADGQDNAIFGDDRVGLADTPDPEGFQHPAQAAYIWYRGFDAVLITVHLSWTNEAKREQEKALLKKVVESAIQIDPDVIVCGDFNTTAADIETLVVSLGLFPGWSGGMRWRLGSIRSRRQVRSRPGTALAEADRSERWRCPACRCRATSRS